jgi:hypothetical protein
MQEEDSAPETGLPSVSPLAVGLRQRLASVLAPLLWGLDAPMDARLVRTFGASVEALLVFGPRAWGLLLSE